MHFNSSKILKFLGRFRIRILMHIKPWVHPWLNRGLVTRVKRIGEGVMKYDTLAQKKRRVKKIEKKITSVTYSSQLTDK